MSHSSYRSKKTNTDELLIRNFAKKYTEFDLPSPQQLGISTSVPYNTNNSNTSSNNTNTNYIDYNSEVDIQSTINEEEQLDEREISQSPQQENSLIVNNNKENSASLEDSHSRLKDNQFDNRTVISHSTYKSDHPLKTLQHNEISAYDELKKISKKKELYEKVFDKYINKEGEDDVDLNEFIIGLKKLKVELNDNQMTQLFEDLDDDSDGYVERIEFVEFLIRNYESQELKLYQDKIIQRILEDKSNFTIQEINKWNDEEISLVEEAMRSEMETMITGQLKKINEKYELEQEIEIRQQTNKNFCNLTNCYNWNIYEVIYYFNNLLKIDYIFLRLYNLQIDGNILLNDVNKSFLINQLGIKTIHVNKILREISKLKSLNDKLSIQININTINIKSQDLNNNKNNIKSVKFKDNIEKYIELEKKYNSIKKQYNNILNNEKEYKEKIKNYQIKIENINVNNEKKIEELTNLHSQQINNHTEKLHELIKQYENRLKEKDENTIKEIDLVKNTLEKSLKENITAKVKIQLSEEYSNKLEKEKDKITKDMERELELRVLKAEQQWKLKYNNNNIINSINSVNETLSVDSNESKNSILSDIDDDNFNLCQHVSYIKKLKEENDSFCNKKLCINWSVNEVSYWLLDLNFKIYIERFYKNLVDGSILIKDINLDTLKNDLEISGLHCNKILRKLDELREYYNNLTNNNENNKNKLNNIPTQLNISDYKNIIYKPVMNIKDILLENDKLKSDILINNSKVKLLNEQNINLLKENQELKLQQKEENKKKDETTDNSSNETKTAKKPLSIKLNASPVRKKKHSFLEVDDNNRNKLPESTPPPPSDSPPIEWKTYIGHLAKRKKDLTGMVIQQKRIINRQMTQLHKQDDTIKAQLNAVSAQNEIIGGLQRKLDKVKKKYKNIKIKTMSEGNPSITNNNNTNYLTTNVKHIRQHSNNSSNNSVKHRNDLSSLQYYYSNNIGSPTNYNYSNNNSNNLQYTQYSKHNPQLSHGSSIFSGKSLNTYNYNSNNNQNYYNQNYVPNMNNNHNNNFSNKKYKQKKYKRHKKNNSIFSNNNNKHSKKISDVSSKYQHGTDYLSSTTVDSDVTEQSTTSNLSVVQKAWNWASWYMGGNNTNEAPIQTQQS